MHLFIYLVPPSASKKLLLPINVTLLTHLIASITWSQATDWQFFVRKIFIRSNKGFSAVLCHFVVSCFYRQQCALISCLRRIAEGPVTLFASLSPNKKRQKPSSRP